MSPGYELKVCKLKVSYVRLDITYFDPLRLLNVTGAVSRRNPERDLDGPRAPRVSNYSPWSWAGGRGPFRRGPSSGGLVFWGSGGGPCFQSDGEGGQT